MNRGFAKDKAVSVATALTGAAFFFGAAIMKRTMIAAIAFAVSACAAKAPLDLPVEASNLDGVMHLIGRFSFAHACPCDGLILTAAHVAHPLYLRPGYQNIAIEYTWSDDRGGEGFLLSDYLFLARDLAVMRVRTGNPAYYRHALKAPQIGETLYWAEFDFSELKKAFATVHREGVLLRIVAGHLILDKMPTHGASGTCLVNSKNEVVAEVAFSHRIGAAIVVALYGPWWPGEGK